MDGRITPPYPVISSRRLFISQEAKVLLQPPEKHAGQSSSLTISSPQVNILKEDVLWSAGVGIRHLTFPS